MKIARDIFRVLAVLLAFGTLVLFFFNFAEIAFTDNTGSLSITGAEAAFGADVTSRLTDVTGAADPLVTFKSGWYLLALISTAFTALFMALGFKFKGATVTAVISGLFSGVILLVLVLTGGTAYIDLGRIVNYLDVSGVSLTMMAYLACAGAFASVVAAVAGILINDRILVLASKGTRVSIFGKIVRFLKDYKGELKKVVWPNFRTVAKNTVVVLVMCAIVGAFIWLVDWGLSTGFKAVLGTGGTTSSSIDYDLTTSSEVSALESSETVSSAVESVE